MTSVRAYSHGFRLAVLTKCIVPPFLRTYTRPLLSAPVSHVTSFLVLHEITALVPLIGLATAFHYANWLPESVVQGKWVQEGVEKWGRYFRRKGWVEDSSSSSSSSSEPVKGSVVGEDELAEKQGNVQDVMMNRGAGWRVVLEVATAWAVVKALLPVRIMACVWATPWFARVGVIPIMGLVRRLAGRSKIP
jgi:hypothetical protein